MKNAKHIENEIERTRGEMTGTLQEIERKLSPNRLVDEAMESMRKMNLGDSHMLDLARDNPIPLALVGLGIGWLAVSTLRGRPLAAEVENYAEDAYTGSLARGVHEAQEWAGQKGATVSGNGGQRVGGAAERTSGELGEMADTAGEQAHEWGDAAESQARRMTQRMGDWTRNMTHHAGDWTRSMTHHAGDWAGRTGDLFDSNPLAVGLLAVVAGLALGAAIPATRREGEMWGETSHDLLEHARQTGRQALQRAGRMVQQAADSGGESGGPAIQRGKETFKEERQQDPTGGTPTTH